MHKPRVLFLCTGNSARSQMAEAFLRAYAGERFEIHSGGLEPKGSILPEVSTVKKPENRGAGPHPCFRAILRFSCSTGY
ncbi:MAG TPA: hypothetical protein VI524_02900 [Anaerolineales bacterium]|nr:hypothetical protein [Anaerolineales bacterium]